MSPSVSASASISPSSSVSPSPGSVSDVYLSIDGVHYATDRLDAAKKVLHDTLIITDIVDETPTRAQCSVRGFIPTVGQELIVALGSDRIFAGPIMTIEQAYVGTPTNYRCHLSAIDYTWLLNRLKVRKKYTAQSATAIAQDLIATYAAGFTDDNVVAGLETVDEISFTEVDLSAALTQLAKRIGGYWYCDYYKDIHFFLNETASNPVDLTSSHPSLTEFVVVRDLGQIVTRVLVEGGGSVALTEIVAGETILPVEDSAWYSAIGGVVVSGPQRITYAGLMVGGTGGLVGPGAAPSSAPTLAMLAGAGVESGAHNYAVTFVTAAGESIAGPIVTITVGTIPVPTSAPSGSLSSGGSVNAGDHHYEYTFVTATGETTPSPLSGLITTGGAAASPPSSAPTAGTPSTGGSVTEGAHHYAFTFVTASGETAASPISGTVTPRVVPSPSSAPSAAKDWGGNLSAGAYQWKVTFVNVAGETTPSSASSSVTMDDITPPTGFASSSTPGSSGSIEEGQHRWRMTWVTAGGETTIGTGGSDRTLSAGQTSVDFNNLSVGPSGTIARKLYRTKVGDLSTYYLLDTINNNNSSVDYTDTKSDASLGATSPATSTAIYRKANLTSIPTSGDATVTARKLYRTVAGGSTFKLVTTINNNTATTYTDNTTDVSLGADAPSSNTATVRTVALTSISTGPGGTTARNVYRTEAGGSTLKLLTTISNNTTTTFNDTIADGSLGASAPTGATLNTVNLTGIAVGNATVTQRKLYRRFNSTGTFKLVTTLADNTTTTYVDTTANASLGADAPSSNTATANQVDLTAIPIGGATVTQRKIYRTVAAGSTLKLLATVADNTTTTYADSTADASLGADAPSSDTSGLAQPEGQVAAGSTTLIVANTAGFAASGGWAVIGNGAQVIRYTGLTGSTLTGIPASGAGAIIASIAYNSSITQAPALTGITASGAGAILYDLIKGDDVNLFVTRNDTAAQTTLSALLSTILGDDSDGVQEDYIQDRRLSQTEAEARGDALLALRSATEVSIRYKSRDPLTKAGRTISVSLGSPTSVTADFKIQQVVISNFHPSPDFYPDFDVQASSTRFSLEDLLRLARQGLVKGIAA